MQLLIKQRIFSWADTYDIYDETGEVRYYVKGKVFSLGHQIHVYEKRSGQEVGSIHQRLFSFTPTFEIVINGQVRGTIRKEFTFFRPRYNVDYLGWDVEGDFFSWDYRVTNGGLEVMSISRELFTWGDTYVLRYRQIVDELPGLMLVIAIDAANCDDD